MTRTLFMDKSDEPTRTFAGDYSLTMAHLTVVIYIYIYPSGLMSLPGHLLATSLTMAHPKNMY